MKKNVASQKIGAQMITAADGTAFTGSVTVYVTGDAGTQAVGSVGSGACTHEGNGYHTYAPAQAETNYDLIAFTFIGTGAIPATVQVFTNTPQTGDSFARLGAPAGASVSADIAAIEAQTDDIGVAGAGLTAVPWNSSWDAEVQSEVADALAAYNAVATTDLPSNFADLAITSTTGRVDVASIEGSDATDQINAACDTALSDYDAPTKSELDSGLAGLNDPTAAAIADAVWREAIGDHDSVSGGTAEALSNASSAGDPWSTSLPGAYGAGTAGYILGTNLDAVLSDIETDTQDIQSRIPAALTGGGNIKADILAISGDTTAADNCELMFDGTGYAGGSVLLNTTTQLLGTTAANQVNAEVDTALADYDPPTKAELDSAVANVSVDEIQATALADLFNTDSGTTYGSAVAGSVVKEIADNAGGSSLTVADIADGVWRELLADHDSVSGSAAEGLSNASAPTAAAVADAVWDEALSGHTTAGSAGKALADIESDATAILADTNELQTDDIPGTLATLATASALATAQADLDTITGTDGVTLATTQGNYAPAVAGDQMDLVNAPNATAVTAIQNGLATSTALTTVDSVVDAIKAKTDSLAFTVAGKVDSNITYVAGTAVTGSGTEGDPWGP